MVRPFVMPKEPLMAYHKDGVPMPPNCVECGVKLRRGAARPGDTESRWYGGKGLCAKCYKAEKSALRSEAKQPDTAHARDISPEEHRANINGLTAYIRARRARGIPPEGTIWDPAIVNVELDLEALAS